VFINSKLLLCRVVTASRRAPEVGVRARDMANDLVSFGNDVRPTASKVLPNLFYFVLLYSVLNLQASHLPIYEPTYHQPSNQQPSKLEISKTLLI